MHHYQAANTLKHTLLRGHQTPTWTTTVPTTGGEQPSFLFFYDRHVDALNMHKITICCRTKTGSILIIGNYCLGAAAKPENTFLGNLTLF